LLIKYRLPVAEETMELPGAGCLAAFAALGKEQGPARNAAETLSAEDTAGYIRHRLKVAGQDDSNHNAVRFDYGAIREIFRYSNGTPRMINAVSDKALPAGYVYRTTTIDRGIVQVALNELKEAS
jgi:hypothetical protein